MTTLAAQAAILEGLLEAVRAETRAVVVFDLDDTLLSTARRHLRILREFASARPAAAPLAALKPQQLLYSITETAKVHGVLEEALLKDLRDFWFARFFTNEYLTEDEPSPGAALYCRDVLAVKGQVVYMTGRDEKMRAGTVAALAAHGFPAPGAAGVALMLKPHFDMPDAEFKDQALKRLADMGQVMGSFENEPTHLNLFYAAFPKARHVFLDTKHSGKPVTPHPLAPWIKDFRRA